MQKWVQHPFLGISVNTNAIAKRPVATNIYESPVKFPSQVNFYLCCSKHHRVSEVTVLPIGLFLETTKGVKTGLLLAVHDR